MMSSAGAAALVQGRDNVLDLGFGGELDRRLGEAETLGAQPHLIDRLFTGNIDDAALLSRERSADLNEQGRFADARLAAQEQHGARHEAATGHPVEFADAARQARQRLGLRIEAREREDAALGSAER